MRAGRAGETLGFIGIDLPGVPSCKLSQAGVADGAAQACGEPLALLVSVFLGFPP